MLKFSPGYFKDPRWLAEWEVRLPIFGMEWLLFSSAALSVCESSVCVLQVWDSGVSESLQCCGLLFPKYLLEWGFVALFMEVWHTPHSILRSEDLQGVLSEKNNR